MKGGIRWELMRIQKREVRKPPGLLKNGLIFYLIVGAE